MIFTSATRCALPTYITRLLGARRPQSLGSELTAVPTTINHPDKGVSSPLTRARPTDTAAREKTRAGGGNGAAMGARPLPACPLRSQQGKQDSRLALVTGRWGSRVARSLVLFHFLVCPACPGATETSPYSSLPSLRAQLIVSHFYSSGNRCREARTSWPRL